jgi:hypothetical protein
MLFLVKFPTTKLHENSCSEVTLFWWTDGWWIYMTRLVVAVHFIKLHKNMEMMMMTMNCSCCYYHHHQHH